MQLAFVARAPGTVTRLKLVKWLFIAGAEHHAADALPFYDFLPYQYGPFSFTAYNEFDKLVRAGLMTASDDSVAIASRERVDAALTKLTRKASAIVDAVLEGWGNLSRSELIERVYEKHPWFASRSKSQAVKPRLAPPAIYTCGYEGGSVDSFLNKLLEKGIRRVVDVRKNAYSNKYGFIGGVLKGHCKNVGIDYVHVPQLGIPSSLRVDLSKPGARSELFAHYRKTIVPEASDAQARVEALMLERPSALLCFEAHAHDCHRGSLAPIISKRVGLDVVHL